MGAADWERLVDVCIKELQFNPRLHLIDAADIHQGVRLEVHFAKFPVYQQLANILSSHPVALLEGLARGMMAQSLARPSTAVVSHQALALQQEVSKAQVALGGQQLLPLKRPVEPQGLVTLTDPGDATASRQLSEHRGPNGQLTEAKEAPVFIMTPKPPAKPLIPGGPCENPFCGVIEAPQWRRIDKKLVCNRCGMYYHRHARFPDWSYLNGASSKQAVRHVVLHRGRQDVSPDPSPGSSPSSPSQVQAHSHPQDPSPAQNQSPARNQASVQPQAPARTKAPLLAPTQIQVQTTPRGEHLTTSGRETDSDGSVRLSNHHQHNKNNCNVHVPNAGNAAALGCGDGSSNNENKDNSNTGSTPAAATATNNSSCPSNTPNANASGVRLAGPALDQEVIFKVLTKQWDQLEPATIRRVHVLLEQLQQEQQKQLVLQQQQQQKQAPIASLDSQDARSIAATAPPASLSTSPSEAAARTQVMLREGGQGAVRKSSTDGVVAVRLAQHQQPQYGHLGLESRMVTAASEAPVVEMCMLSRGGELPGREGPDALQSSTGAAVRGGTGPAAKQQKHKQGHEGSLPSDTGRAAAHREGTGGVKGLSGVGRDLAAGTLAASLAGAARDSERRNPRGPAAAANAGGGIVSGADAEPPPPKRVRAAGQGQGHGQARELPPQRATGEASSLGDGWVKHQQQQAQELLLPPVLVAMLQHSKAVTAAQNQQDQQTALLEAHKFQQQRQQRQQQSLDTDGVADGPQPQQQLLATSGSARPAPVSAARSLLETIAQVAQHHEHHQRQAPQPQQPQRRARELHAGRVRATSDADVRAEAMDWSCGAAEGYVPVAGGSGVGNGSGGGGGGMLMRDLQHRALFIQQQLQQHNQQQQQQQSFQQRSNGSGCTAAAAEGISGRGPVSTVELQVCQGIARNDVPLPPGAPFSFVRRPSDACVHDQRLQYKVAGSVAVVERVDPPPPHVVYGGSSGSFGGGRSSATGGHGLEGPGGLSYVDTILDMLLARGAGGKGGRALQQSQLAAEATRLEGASIAGGGGIGFSHGVLGGVRQPSGGSAGLVLLPVLDLGKPPTALAF